MNGEKGVRLVSDTLKRKVSRMTNGCGKAYRCFSPPLTDAPRSPTIVSYPFGNSSIKLCAFAETHASTISSCVASGLPYEIFSLVVHEEKKDEGEGEENRMRYNVSNHIIIGHIT